MNPNIKFSERAAVLATIDPVSQAAGTVTTGWVSMANFHSLVALIDVGVFGASATVDAKLQQAQDNTGTGAKDITNKAITQLVAAGGNNRQAIVETRGEELDVNNGFGFVRLSITVGTAATVIQATVLGVNSRFAAASTFNQAGVAQII